MDLTDENGQNHTSTDNPLILTSSKNIIVDAEFYPIPPEEVDFTIASTPGEAGILFDDPDQRVWNVDKDTIDRNISVASQPGFSFVGWSISPMQICPLTGNLKTLSQVQEQTHH